MKTYKVTYEGGAIDWRNIDGQLDREDGPAYETPNYKAWYRDGQLHRGDNLPAEEFGHGAKNWWVKGRRHRTDGPAIVSAKGFERYFVLGLELSKEDFYKKYPKNYWSAEDYEVSAKVHELVDERMRKMLNDYGQEYYTSIITNLQLVESTIHTMLEGMQKDFENESYMEKDISKWSSPDLEGLVETFSYAVKAKVEFDCLANMCEDIVLEE